MSKPDITLQPSQRVISDAAARIYSAYVAAGRVKDDEVETWIKRSIREAAAIARAIGASIESHDALGIDESAAVRSTTDARKSADTEKKARMEKGKSPTSEKSEMTTKAKPRSEKAILEELAEEALLENAAEHDAGPLELEEQSDTSNIPDSSPQPTAGKTGEPELKKDTATAAAEALERISREEARRAKK